MKKSMKKSLYEEARELRYNKNLSIEELASHYGKSERTIYRWLNYEKRLKSSDQQKSKKKRERSRKYPLEIFCRIVEIKKEISQRSTPIVRKILKKEFPTMTPSLSTIRKYIRDQGLTYKKINQKQGYIKFERKKPNDL